MHCILTTIHTIDISNEGTTINISGDKAYFKVAHYMVRKQKAVDLLAVQISSSQILKPAAFGSQTKWSTAIAATMAWGSYHHCMSVSRFRKRQPANE